MTGQARLKRQPEDDPEGWVALRRAFLRFGRAAIGSDWDTQLGIEVIERAIGAGALPPMLEAPRAEAVDGDFHLHCKPDDLAALVVRSVCISFASAVRAGRLRVSYARKGAGEVVTMPVGAWRTDDPFIRFDGWSFDPANEGAAGLKLPYWAFVGAAELSALLDEVAQWRAALPEFSGDLLQGDDEPVDCLCGFPVQVIPLGDKLLLGAPRLPKFERQTSNVVRLVAHASESGASLERLPFGEFRKWVRDRIAGGATKSQVECERKQAFPGFVVPSRDRAREVYDEVWRETQSAPLRPGPRTA